MAEMEKKCCEGESCTSSKCTMTHVVMIGLVIVAIIGAYFLGRESDDGMKERAENRETHQGASESSEKMQTETMMSGEQGEWTDEEMAMMDTEHMEGSEDAMMAGTGEWTEEEMAEMAMHDGDDMMMSETTDAMMSETVGEYVVYNGTSFPKNDHVVLFFHATWCPSCKSADTNLSASEIPAGYSIVKVDYDTYGDLKQKYGIVSQHTFVVVDVNGEMIKKWVGASTIDDVVDGVQG